MDKLEFLQGVGEGEKIRENYLIWGKKGRFATVHIDLKPNL
jgi:hypothetical protein